jgi:hypothetical protein
MTPDTPFEAGDNYAYPFGQFSVPLPRRGSTIFDRARRGGCLRGHGRGCAADTDGERHGRAGNFMRFGPRLPEHMGIADSRWNPSGSEKQVDTSDGWGSNTTVANSPRDAENFDAHYRDAGNGGCGSQWGANGNSSG